MTKKSEAVLTVLALLAIAGPLAFDLGRAPIQTWDEARQAVNALEMLRSGGQWLVTTFQHQPDLWNTKPPLLIWLQALSMCALGPTALAVRLPTLLATLGTVGLLYAAGRGVGRPALGLLAGALLVTMPGYVGPHVARSGDYDALLCALVLGQVLATFRYAETGRRRYLALAAAAVGSAVLTKGVAGLLGLPSLGLYLLLDKKLGLTLRQPAFWLAAVGALAGPVLYYVLRERALPGYWAAVWANELGGRYAHNMSAAQRPPLYHLHNLLRAQCRLWAPLLPLAGLLALGPPTASRRLGQLLALFLGNWLVVISLAKTKLEWYTAPMLPPLALLLALGLGAAYAWGRARLPRRPVPGQWPLLGGALALGLVAGPYSLTISRLVADRTGDPAWGGLNRYGTYLRDYRSPPLPTQLLVYYPVAYPTSLQFYQAVLAERGVAVQAIGPDSLPPALAPGTHVLVCLPHLRARLRQRYALRLLDQRAVCTLYEVQGPLQKFTHN